MDLVLLIKVVGLFSAFVRRCEDMDVLLAAGLYSTFMLAGHMFQSYGGAEPALLGGMWFVYCGAMDLVLAVMLYFMLPVSCLRTSLVAVLMLCVAVNLVALWMYFTHYDVLTYTYPMFIVLAAMGEVAALNFARASSDVLDKLARVLMNATDTDKRHTFAAAVLRRT